jgi:hypothetical protein
MNVFVSHRPGQRPREVAPAPMIFEDTDAVFGVNAATICGTVQTDGVDEATCDSA